MCAKIGKISLYSNTKSTFLLPIKIGQQGSRIDNAYAFLYHYLCSKKGVMLHAISRYILLNKRKTILPIIKTIIFAK